MTLQQALNLKVNGIVYCPPDRGDLAYTGRITHIDTTVNKTLTGTEYIWVTVREPNEKFSHVWPSNRLG